MPFYEYHCDDCDKTLTMFWPKADGGPGIVQCDCSKWAVKALSWVAHRHKEKGDNHPIPEGCK